MSRMIRKPEDLPVIDVLVVVLSVYRALLSMLCDVLACCAFLRCAFGPDCFALGIPALSTRVALGFFCGRIASWRGRRLWKVEIMVVGRSRFLGRNGVWVLAAMALAYWVGGVNVVRADLFQSYSNMEVFELPVGTSVFDVGADGRIIALVGADVYIENVAGGRSFLLYGTLPGADIASFGAAFIAVSPDGTRISVGNNGGASFGDFQVGVFDFSTLTGDWVAADHFVGLWMDGSRLIIAASDFVNGSTVTVLDAFDADSANWTNTTVVENIGGAAGGIALDGAGNLFAGNGFSSSGPSGTGAVKIFLADDWTAALSGGAVVDFEIGGVLVVDLLSASPLAFDVEGNLLVGGGDAAPDDDSVAIVRAGALSDAVAGMSAVDVNDPLAVRRVDPIAANDFNFYSCGANLVLGEFYVRDFGASTVYVYRDSSGVPALGEWGMVCMSLSLLSAGTVIVRRSAGQFGLAA